MSVKIKHRVYKDFGLPYFVPNNETSDRSSASDSSTDSSEVEEFAIEAAHVQNELRRTNMALLLRHRLARIAKPILGRRVGLSQRERRATGLFRLQRFSPRYEEALPMNRMWEQYMHKFIRQEKDKWYNPKNGNMWDQIKTTLMRADLHGARVKVFSSLCTSSMTGLEGIILVDTKYTFQILCTDDVCRTIPKESSSFDVFFKAKKFRILGKYFSIRSNVRSARNIKCSFIPPSL